MHTLTDKDLPDALLDIALSIPTDLPLNILPVRGMPLVIIWDCREEAEAAMLGAVASRFGPVVASSRNHLDKYKRQAVAAMIRIPPGSDPESVVGELRVAYTTATTEDGTGEHPEPL